MTSRATYGFAAAAFAAAVLLSACSGGGDDSPTTTPAPSTSSTPPPPVSSSQSAGKPKPKPPAKPKKNPLTGGKPTDNGVVAVKIDDTGNGRPQVNINHADVVYVEQVEGGLTRLLAIYNSTLPTVEAVRSTRASDPELVGQYGPIGYVASGGSWSPLKILRNSPLKTSINDAGGPGFQRDPNRPAPYNLRADLGAIAKKLKAPQAKPVGFHWAWDSSQLKGAPPGVHVRTVVGSTPVAFDYSAKTNHYNRLINGFVQKTAGGRTVAASNVLVQFCKVTTFAKDRDVNGSPSKWTHSIGKGKAVLFRGGKRLVGTWERTRYTGGTTFKTAKGKDMLFRPGQVWIVLAAKGAYLG